MSTKGTPILRQKNPSGRVTYWTPEKYGMRRLTRPQAMHLIETGEAYWAGKPAERSGGPGAPSVGVLVDALTHGQMSLRDLAG